MRFSEELRNILTEFAKNSHEYIENSDDKELEWIWAQDFYIEFIEKLGLCIVNMFKSIMKVRRGNEWS